MDCVDLGQKTHAFGNMGKINSFNGTHAVLLLLHLEDSAIVEGPLDDISLLLRLNELAALQRAPEVLEVLD
jgi:hypothetical protein